MTVITRWDLVLYKNAEGHGGKVIPHDSGGFVKYVDYMQLVNEAQLAVNNSYLSGRDDQDKENKEMISILRERIEVLKTS